MNRYYDVVLALIPLALLGLGSTLVVAGVGRNLAVTAAGLTAVALVGHALFVNGPVAASPQDARESTAGHDSGSVGSGPMNAD